MTPPIRVATFDVYGTLIDWEGGAASFLYELASRHEPAPPPARELRERWEALQFERLQGDWRQYSEVLSDSLAEWVAERGYRWNEHDGEGLVRSMKSWQPFPDTVPSLREAKEAGLELWLISNTDRSIIEHTLRHLEVPFDGIVVAEDCRAYKPSHKPFEHALRQINASPDEILHVAFGYKYDIGPAKQLGLRTAWVNRHGEEEPGEERPDHEWLDLRPLPSVNG
jgi:2-haloalkanoic acid dehalogenase type II